jgi:3-dehydroquinate synthase
MDRHSPVVAVGGGVVGDLAGFAGSAFMRGLPVVQVPTTLLAQVDASVGGKVAVNHPRGKNLIGAFHQPRLVLIDPETLRTLPDREYRSGLAEIVKTGAALDAELFRALEAGVEALRRRDAGLLESVVATCCAAKARIVERDEREETGLRMVLNYGHTVGHALEALSGYRRWAHGEAVAIGMAAVGRLAVRMGWVSGDVAARQDALLQAVGLPTRFSGIDPREIVDSLRHDKKARDGRVPFILMRDIGRVEPCDEVPMDTVLQVLREIQE